MENNEKFHSGRCRFYRVRYSLLLSITTAFCTCSSLSSVALAQHPEPATTAQMGEKMTRICISLSSGKQLSGTIGNNAAARDFLSLLPLTLTLNDYQKTEKVSDLPKVLSTQGEPEGFDPDVGDITYYAPWGNLAIFYRDFGYASGLVKLGKIDAGMELLQHQGSFNVTIEKANSR